MAAAAEGELEWVMPGQKLEVDGTHYVLTGNCRIDQPLPSHLVR